MKIKTKTLYIILVSILFILLALCICIGSTSLKLKEVYLSLINSPSVSSTKRYIVVNLRLPRTLGAIFVGICLSCCAIIFQSVFKNPMADSYVLGLSSSSTVSIAIAMFIFSSNIISWKTLPFVSFIGSLLCTLLLFFLNRKDHMRLLLSGIALNFFLGSLTSLFLFLNRKQMDTILFWTMGSLSSLNWNKISYLFIASVLSLIITQKEHNVLDLLLLDDSTSISSGLDVNKARITLLIFSSLITSIVVSFCGVIGFVGMMSPHIIRSIIGPKHKNLIFLSMLFASDLMMVSDLISRTIIMPSELPIGIVTSILGAPVFFILLKRAYK